VAMLLYPSVKNSYTASGYNWADGLYAYFPGNGGLLLAVAALAGGFSDSSNVTVPIGFPASWHASVEGFDVSYP
jgi:protein-glucosylgalactosylhydroxylysine glucosidase